MTTSDSGDLPLPDYDQLALGELEHRIRSLAPDELERLAQYEREHANRTPVNERLAARLAELHAGAVPSPGGNPRPGQAAPTRGTSPVDPSTSPQPFSAPPHGSPHQRGQPKGDDRRP
ncbi:hypothetical protein PJ985_03390 [Streptomyces sp. ACA25]|uniref:hypothetical protein n=1 Tax=Streptomyces sp. ACA25 TaxID=3022596 RepID=UPI002307E627|nr:hypothetical protein [Streptomyces sp. ACA25]MDB1086610.1 hypothetical protein [Streptomyces sp. ACA25]